MKISAVSAARDRSERAFGMGFVKLMNADGTTLQDGKHNLIVYKVTRPCLVFNPSKLSPG